VTVTIAENLIVNSSQEREEKHNPPSMYQRTSPVTE